METKVMIEDHYNEVGIMFTKVELTEGRGMKREQHAVALTWKEAEKLANQLMGAVKMYKYGRQM